VDFDLNSANLLNLARLGLVPVFLLLAYARKGWWFAGVWVTSELCSIIANVAGRGQESEILDIGGDLAAYVAVLISLFILLRNVVNTLSDGFWEYTRMGWSFMGVSVFAQLMAFRGSQRSGDNSYYIFNLLEERYETISYVTLLLGLFFLWRGVKLALNSSTPIRITFWTTAGERPRLETAFQGRDKARVLDRCGEPDEETVNWLYYQHLTFREPNERATTRPVRFLLSGDNVIHIEVGAVNPD